MLGARSKGWDHILDLKVMRECWQAGKIELELQQFGPIYWQAALWSSVPPNHKPGCLLF